MSTTHHCPRRRWLIAAVGTLAVLAGGAPARAATAVPAPVAPAPGGEFLDVDARPVLTWSVPSRYGTSWSAYNAVTARYDRDVVNPKFWPMRLNGCASTSVRRITRFTFTLTRVGATWTRTYDGTACDLHLKSLPAQGLYRASLVLHTDWGASAGVSRPAMSFPRIRDYLIVSMGDSLASGEGNPDVRGSYRYSIDQWLRPSVQARTAARWKDTRCHRSARSGPALAAQAFEDASPYTSVTFVSVACSGAEVRHLITDRYAGIAPYGGLLMPPQVNAVASLVGPRPDRPGRRIDALLISAGVNNLGFSDIIRRCVLNNNYADNHTSCVNGGGVVDKVQDLTRQYAYLALALQVRLPTAREVYLNDYPSEVFRGGACGLLRPTVLGGVLGIDAAEGLAMTRLGNALNARITRATDMFRAYRWNKIGSLTGPFHGHAYCDRGTWFTSLGTSLAIQGDVNGTAHPNAVGHWVYGGLLRRAIVPDQTARAYRRLTVTINALKASASSLPALRVNPVLSRYQSDPYGLTHALSVPRNGRWTAVPASVGTFSLDVFRAPASPRHATRLFIGLGHILAIRHSSSDAYGAGRHVLTSPTGQLSVFYTVVPTVPPPSLG